MDCEGPSESQSGANVQDSAWLDTKKNPKKLANTYCRFKQNHTLERRRTQETIWCESFPCFNLIKCCRSRSFSAFHTLKLPYLLSLKRVNGYLKKRKKFYQQVKKYWTNTCETNFGVKLDFWAGRPRSLLGLCLYNTIDFQAEVAVCAVNSRWFLWSRRPAAIFEI